MSQDLNGSPASAATPPPTPAVAAAGGVRGAIARASQATGVDFSYLLAQARLESSLDPHARATTTSAAGLYQFTKGTWGTMLARHGAALGLDSTAAATGAIASLPTSRAQLMALRYDPNAAAMMAAELAGDNATALTTALGRAPTPSELYLAHFLGSAGATRFLGALAADPGQSGAALLPKAASANRAVFFDAGGAPRSVGAIMNLIQTRMDAALQDGTGQDGTGQDVNDPGANAYAVTGDSDASAVYQVNPGPIARQFTETQAASGAAQTTPDPNTADATMSDTLRNTFGLSPESTAEGAAPAFVRSAYGRMQALGL